MIVLKEVWSHWAHLLLHPLPCLWEGEQDRGGLPGDRVIPNEANESTLKMLRCLADGHELHWGVEDCAISAPFLNKQISFKFLEASHGLLKHLNFICIPCPQLFAMQVCQFAIPGFPSPIFQWQPPSLSTPQMWPFPPVVPLGCSPPPLVWEVGPPGRGVQVGRFCRPSPPAVCKR
jgi:hypothetical protein